MIVLVLNWYKEVFKRFGEEGGQANGRGENKVYSPILQRAGQKGSNVGEGKNILWFTSIILCCSWLEALARSNYAIILKIVSFIFQCNVLCTHTVKPKYKTYNASLEFHKCQVESRPEYIDITTNKCPRRLIKNVR